MIADNQRKSSNKVAKGTLWIFSGWIIIFITAIMQTIVRFVLADGPEVMLLLANIFSWIAGVAGVLLVFVGPIVGIIILTRKSG